MQASETATNQQQASLPAEWKRTAVSFLIFLHLFALAVAILSNWNPSQLSLRLRRVPGVKPYLEYLAMDQSYVPLYGLTFGMQDADTDVSAEIDLAFADGTNKNFTLPQSGLVPRQRWRHDERLAETAAAMSGDDFRNVESLLPQAIAAHYVAEYGAKGGVIRLRRHNLQLLEAMSSSNPLERAPFDPSHYARVYEARILVSDGAVQLLKSESAAEVAPAANAQEGK